eukprot:2746777-Pyramimonas_sp.AAC.1
MQASVPPPHHLPGYCSKGVKNATAVQAARSALLSAPRQVAKAQGGLAPLFTEAMDLAAGADL